MESTQLKFQRSEAKPARTEMQSGNPATTSNQSVGVFGGRRTIKKKKIKMEAQQEVVGTLQQQQESQISQNHQNNSQALQQHSLYNINQQYNQGAADQFVQYLPGQHWLAGPGNGSSDQNNYNSSATAVGGFGGSQLSHFSGQYNNGGGPMISSTSTIHHTGPQQQQQQQHALQQQLLSSTMGSSCHHQQCQSSSSPYSAPPGAGVTNNGNRVNRNMNINAAAAPPPYLGLTSCNNYSHQHHHPYHYHGPNSSSAGFSNNQSCHYHHHHHGQQMVMGSSSSTPQATAPKLTKSSKMKKSSAAAAAAATPVVASSSLLPIPPRIIPWRPSSEIFSYGGLSVLWRQVPEACQKILTVQDIPDTVKVRGYFTVCELLELKRNLMGRLCSIDNMNPEGHLLPHEESVGVVVKQAMDTLDNAQALDADNYNNKGFAFKTVGHRLPVILTKVIDQLSRDKNEIGDNLSMDARDEVKTVIGALAKLKNEMQTNKSMPKTGCPVWDDYLEVMGQRYFEGKTLEIKWYLAPWLFVECYMYKRLNDAFQSTKFLKEYDVFKKQKENGWLQSLDAACVLGKFIQSAAKPMDNVMMEEMLEISLWGNRCDLSISQGEDNSQMHNIVEQLQDLKKFILCDDAPKFWKYLLDKRSEAPIISSSTNTTNMTDAEISIGYVLDNAGFELFTDLCFADSLMSKVDRIDFHVKVMPWFVSDALQHDFDWLIDSMSNAADNPILVDFGKRWKGYLQDKKWTVIGSSFWTYPHAFHEMSSIDPNLFSTLQRNTVLIFKGDLNYRKLIGDINWPTETPFKDSLQGFWPSPLIALRTLKADCVAGLKPGLAKEIQAKNPDWMVTGEYGVIQFCGATC